MSPLKTFWLAIRSTLFWIGCLIYTLIQGILIPFYFLMPYPIAYKMLFSWSHFCVAWLKITCGVDYTITGLDNLKQDRAHILLANHQSTWETMAISLLPPRFVWVIKKELEKVPIFGLGTKVAKCIAIDRSSGTSAVEQINTQGKARLDEGLWIIMFPEGTRTAVGSNKRFKPGGAILASNSGYDIIPMAHNAGVFWPKHSYLKHPGTIEVRIGKPIKSQGRPVDEINKEVEVWVRAQLDEMPQTPHH